VILVIDCGLSAVKISVADTDGRVVARERAPYTTLHQHDVSEQQPADWWGALESALARAPHRREISVVVATGHMHGLVLVDDALRPLLPCLTLHDRRGAEHLARFDPERFRLATGEILDASLPLAKLLWLADKQPELLDRATALLAPKDYLQARLTGRIATDPVDAAGTGLFDPGAGIWSQSVLSDSGLPDHFLPPVLPATDLAPIRAEVADHLGLPRSSLVAVGAGDDIELLGATAHRTQSAVEHVGTTGAIIRPLADSAHVITDAAIEVYPTAAPWRLAAGVSTAQVGAVFEWLQRQLGVHSSEIFERDPSGKEPVVTARLFAERGNGSSNGGTTIRGLKAEHNRVDLSRGLIIATTIKMRELLTHIEECTGTVDTIYASGSAGGSSWTRWRAAAYGRPLVVLRDDPTARGCVTIALAALTGRRDIESLAAGLPDARTIVEPSPALGAMFDGLAAVAAGGM
jgi:xylulokinase